MPEICANIWLDKEAEEAARFYTELIPNSRITETTHYAEAGQEIHGRPPGSIMTVDFELDGFRFTALNGGPYFTLNPSMSFFVNCETAEEVDRIWGALSDGGTPLMPLDEYPFNPRYGWIQDRYGVSWQLIVSDDAATQRIVPSFLFTGEVCGKAEEAINFYTGIFGESRLGDIARYGPDAEVDREGTVMFSEFKLEGQWFAAMDSAQDHRFTFNEGISLIVDARDQEQIDYYWDKLSAVPDAEQCGWLKDRYGVSWQVFPTTEMTRMMKEPGKERLNRVMNAMLAMKKIDLAGLRAAAE